MGGSGGIPILIPTHANQDQAKASLTWCLQGAWTKAGAGLLSTPCGAR